MKKPLLLSGVFLFVAGIAVGAYYATYVIPTLMSAAHAETSSLKLSDFFV